MQLSIEDEKSLSKALLVLTADVVLAFLCFMVLSFLSFTLVHFLVYGSGSDSVHLFEHNALRVLTEPGYFFDVYAGWWSALLKSIRTLKPVWALFIPLPVPFISLAALWYAFARSSYSFSLWFILSRHFAKLEDVRKMGLLKGILLVLGRFESYILGLNRPAAVLCLGETGSGKTSTVAIPSILRSDNISVIAVDNTGSLARHTSGYRATLGPVFYFNWDWVDDVDKGAFYPRWNPLAAENLPPIGAERDGYIRLLASYMISDSGHLLKDNYWDWLAAGALAAFMSFMASKCAQAAANDYFLNKILETGRLSKDDKDVLLSYYALMPEQYAQKAMHDIQKEKIGIDDYFPIGSWDGIPAAWQGKDLCLAMLTDWLLKNYLGSKDDNNSGDWRQWLEKLLVEAALFNYGSATIAGLRQFLDLSKQQRQPVFAYVLKPLKAFFHQALRERTSGNDLRYSELRGIFNPEDKKWEPVTVYSTAGTKGAKFISRLFIEMLLSSGVLGAGRKGALPVLTVLDDAGQMPRIRGLVEGAARSVSVKASFLILCNSLNAMEQTYGRETLENLAANSSYKIIMADNSLKMSRQLDKLAIFSTRSVQIPLGGKRRFYAKKYFADANYYHRLANELKANKKLSVETKGYQILLAEGYYHRPVLTRHIHFLHDDKFKDKALREAAYFVSETILNRRNMQDVAVPKVEEVLYDADFGIDDEVELEQYINVVYAEAAEEMQKENNTQKEVAADSGAEEDWWLNEKAFDLNNGQMPQNPFEVKK